MNAVFAITSSTTVNGLAAELYDIKNPATGLDDTSRRDGAAGALRQLNGSLPSDETSFDGGTVSFVWVPKVPGLSFRLHPTIRGDLEGEGLRNVDQLALCNEAWVSGKFSGTPSASQIDRAIGIARLMRVNGLGRDLAASMYDDTTMSDPVQRPRELAAADQAELKTFLQSLSLPSAYLALEPWYVLQRRAQRGTRPRRQPSIQYDRVRVLSPVAAAAEARWRSPAASPRRSARQRASASTIQWAYSVLQVISEGTTQLAAGKPRQAATTLRSVYAQYADKAVELGIISSGSAEASEGASVETALEVTWRLLNALEASDVDEARRQFDLPPSGTYEGLCALALTDLANANNDTVTNALNNSSHRVDVLGPGVRERLLSAYSDSAKGNLPSWAATGVGTVNSNGLLRDFGQSDFEQAAQNVGAATFTELINDGPTWLEVESAVSLFDVDGQVGTSLDSGGSTPSASAVLSSTALASMPGHISNLMSSMTPFQRYYSCRTGGMHIAAPLNSGFPSYFRNNVLAPMLDNPDASVWMISEENHKDPAALLFLLPAMMSRQLPISIANAHMRSGRTDVGAALYDTLPTAADVTSALDTSFDSLVPEGIAGLRECPGPQELLTQVRELNANGDAHYRAQYHDAAANFYTKVISLATRCPAHETWYEDMDGLDVAMSGLQEDLLSVGTTLLDQDRFSQQAGMAALLKDLATNTYSNLFDSVYIDVSPTFPTLVEVEQYNVAVLQTVGSAFWFHSGSLVVPAASNGIGGQGTVDSEDGDPGDTTGGGTGTARHGQVTVEIDLRAEVRAELLHARTQLQKLNSGLNWLGLDPDTVPAWTYEYLFATAKDLASRADALQQRGLNTLRMAEGQLLEEVDATSSAEIAAASEAVAQARVSAAQAGLERAHASLEAAELAESHAKDARFWSYAQGVLGVAQGIATTVSGVGLIAEAGKGLANEALGAARGFEGGGGILGSIAAMQQAQNAVQAAKQRVAIAQADESVASAMQIVASNERTVATLRSSAAKQRLEIVMGKQGSSEALFALMDLIEIASSQTLQLATTMAWLAERALWYSSKRSRTFVSLDYAPDASFETRFGGAAALVADLDAMNSARIMAVQQPRHLIKSTVSMARQNPNGLLLLQNTGMGWIDVHQHLLDLRHPGLYLHALKRVEVEFDGLVPVGAVHATLRRAGAAHLRVPNNLPYIRGEGYALKDWAYDTSDFDFPGATTPERNPKFVQKWIRTNSQVQILSEYRPGRDGAILSQDPGTLQLLENSPPAGTWLVEIANQGGTVDPARITDVRLTLYFSADYSQALADQQKAVLQGPGKRFTQSIQRLASAHELAALEALTSEPYDQSVRDVRLLSFGVDSDAFPPRTRDRVLQNFAWALYGLGQTPLKARVACPAFPMGVKPSDGTSHDAMFTGSAPVPPGLLFSGVGLEEVKEPDADGTLGTTVLQQDLRDTYEKLDDAVKLFNDDTVSTNFDLPVGTWTLKVLPDDNPSFLLLDDDGDPVEVTAGSVELQTGDKIRFSGGSWKHATVRLVAELANGTLAITLRDGGTAATATITVEDGTSAGKKFTCAVTGGTSVVYDNVVLDAMYQVELRVVGTEGTLLLDGQVVATSTALTSSAGSVSAEVTSGSSTMVLSALRVTRLRHDGSELSDVVDERFEALDAWEQTNTPVRLDRVHNILDLSLIDDVMLAIDYTTEVAFSV